MDMRALITLLEGRDEFTDVVIRTNCPDRFVKLLEWVKLHAGWGTGITITAEDNGGETCRIQIDGDGPDRIDDITTSPST